MGENRFETIPVEVYGVVLLMCGVSFNGLAASMVRAHGPARWFHPASGPEVLWFVPDRRIEKVLAE